LVRDIGIIPHNLQFTQALGADDLILAIDEHLGAQLHLLAVFGTGVIHIARLDFTVAKLVKITLSDNSLQKPCRLTSRHNR
jgi:hypothetical protein